MTGWETTGELIVSVGTGLLGTLTGCWGLKNGWGYSWKVASIGVEVAAVLFGRVDPVGIWGCGA